MACLGYISKLHRRRKTEVVETNFAAIRKAVAYGSKFTVGVMDLMTEMLVSAADVHCITESAHFK